MIRQRPIDSLAPSFWTRPEAINAWRLCFEEDTHRIRLLMRVLRHLPNDRGRLEFIDETRGDRFILLLTWDLTNNLSWQNQAWILSVLVETRAVNAVAVENAFEAFDFTRLRAFDVENTRKVAVEFLQQGKIAAPSFVGITASESVVMFGIDRRELYEIAEKYVLVRNAAYFDAIRRRAPILLQNTLTEMDKRNLSVIAVCLSEYNYDEFRWMLVGRKIAHAGIRPRVGGPSVSFEEFWRKAKIHTPLDYLFNPELGLGGRFRRAIGAIRRRIGI